MEIYVVTGKAPYYDFVAACVYLEDAIKIRDTNKDNLVIINTPLYKEATKFSGYPIQNDVYYY